MGAAIPLRGDFYAAKLRGLAQRSRDGAQNRRLLTLAAIYDGHRRSDAARFAGVGLQIVRDWVLRFNAEGPEGLKDRKAAGPPRKLSEEQRAALAAICRHRPGRLAYLLDAPSPPQHHPAAAPAPSAGTQSGRERLAVLARQLALEPHLPRLRRHPRSLLPSLEQTRRTASSYRLYRNPKMGL